MNVVLLYDFIVELDAIGESLRRTLGIIVDEIKIRSMQSIIHPS
jgi:hypothetical protein